MTTIPYKPGASEPFIVSFENETGGQERYAAAQLRIETASACVRIDGAGAVDGYQFILPALPPRLYTATVYVDAGAGWRFMDRLYLLSEGGC
ncbi:hypothetical protein [Paracoccus indicus]|uniref:hypothetical protein n=1 Tax=Paracoccus indicus TaxID=2079229 RepID=UPI000D3D9311|nr:hypothetical protein [Paracoccus indicus]